MTRKRLFFLGGGENIDYTAEWHGHRKWGSRQAAPDPAAPEQGQTTTSAFVCHHDHSSRHEQRAAAWGAAVMRVQSCYPGGCGMSGADADGRRSAITGAGTL